MIARSVPEIEGGSPEKKKKDWSWSILVVGYDARYKRPEKHEATILPIQVRGTVSPYPIVVTVI